MMNKLLPLTAIVLLAATHATAQMMDGDRDWGWGVFANRNFCSICYRHDRVGRWMLKRF